MPEQNGLFGKIETEFKTHAQDTPHEEFAFSPMTSQEFSKLARDLEFKRQEGALTDAEEKQLHLIDEWIEKIANFNQNIQHESSGKQDFENIYNFEEKTIEASDAADEPLIVPQVSEEQAEDIIKGLDEQFEEKVMSKIDKDRKKEIESVDKVEQSDSVLGGQNDDAERGRSLNDFIGNIRQDRPSQPFKDDDSHMSLADLVKGKNKKSE